MKTYTSEINNQPVIIAEPDNYNSDSLNSLLDEIAQTKITFHPEIKVRANNRFSYISEIKKVRTVYMVKIEVGDDSAFRQVRDLDNETIKAITGRLKNIFKK